MWSKKLRKIVDISVLAAVGVTLLTIGGVKMFGSLHDYNVYSDAYDAAEQARLDAMKDENGRIPENISGVDPTETSVGYTAGKRDTLTGEIFEGHEEIPMLNEENYDRTVKSSTSGMVVTWTIKQAYIDEHLPGHTTSEFTYSQLETKGYISVNGTNYLAPEFNKAFSGIEMTYDKATSLITWNVTQESLKFENCKIALQTIGDTLKITGNPLIIETPGTQNGVDLKSANDNLIIDNDTTICVTKDKFISTNYNGIACHNLIINEGKSLHVRNYYYGIYSEGEITVNGSLNTSGSAYKYSAANADSAVFAKNDFADNIIHIGSGKAVYSEEKKLNVTDNKIRFDDCGKHLIICDETADLDDMLSYVIVGFPVTPTATSSGVAQFGCDCCDTPTDKTFELPPLSSDNYDISSSVESIDGAVYATTKYELKDDSHGKIAFYTDKVKLTHYIKSGNFYLSEDLWNAKYPNAVMSSSGSSTSKVLTITLNGTQNIDMSEYLEKDAATGTAFDFKLYSKVIINGSGTLNFNYTLKSAAMAVKELEIADGATVNLNGVDRGTTGNQASYYAVSTTSSIKVAGKLNIVKFASGFYVASSATVGIDIESTGEVTMSNMSNSIYTGSSSKVTLNNKGKLDISADNASCFNIKSEGTLTFTCSGSSVTNITNGYGIDGYNNKCNINIFIQDSSTFTVTSTQYAIYNYAKFVVGNGDDGLTKCNATVSVTTSVNSPLYAKPVAATTGTYTVFNSSNPVTLKKTGSAASCLILIDGNKNHVFKALSNVDCVNTKSIFTFKNTPQFNAGDFVVEDPSGNPVFSVDSKFVSDYTNTTDLPANIPATIQKRQ